MSLLAYLAVAAIVLWISQVSYRRVGRLASVVLVLSPLALTGRALVSDRVLGPIDLPYNSEPLSAFQHLLGSGPRSPGILSDIHAQMIPWRAAVRHAWNSGEWPLWNPWMLNGDLLLASAQAAPLGPFSAAELLLPIELSLGFSLALTLFFASLGAVLFFRTIGISTLGSLLGGIAWSWSGFLLFWLHWPIGRCAAFYPWILLATYWIVRRPGPRPGVALAVLLAAALLSGHPETVVHLVVLGSAFGVSLLGRSGWRSWVRSVSCAFAAGALALLLAAAFVLPFVSALPESTPFQQRRAHSTLRASAPIEDSASRLLTHVAPFVYGTMGKIAGRAPQDWAFPATSYIGSILIGLAACGAVARRFRHRGFVIGSLLFCLAASVSMYPVANLLSELPLLALTLNERLAFGAAFSVAWCAALGFDRLMASRRAGARRERIRGGAFATAAIVAVALGSICAVGAGIGMRFDLPEVYELRHSMVLIGAAMIPFVLLAIRLERRVAFALLLAGLLWQRMAEMGYFYPSFPRSAFYPAVAPLASLPDPGQLHRVVGAGFSWLPNESALYRLEDSRGYQAMTNARLEQTFSLWSTPQPVSHNRIDDLDRPFLRFLNVRFAIAPLSYRPGRQWDVVAQGGNSQLLENRSAAARFFLPRTLRIGSSRDLLARETASETNFVRRVRIEPMAPRPGVGVEPVSIRNPAGRIEARARGSAYELELDLPREAWVASSITAWSGWRVLHGGTELPLAYANHAFLAFLAPPGKSSVRVVYRPRSFDLGLALSALGLVLAVAVTVRSRRAPPKPEVAADPVG